MRIVCPTCEATYNVPDAALSPGRPVRCARCGNNWIPQRELLLGELWLEPGTGAPRPVQGLGPDQAYPPYPRVPDPGFSAPGASTQGASTQGASNQGAGTQGARLPDGTGPRTDQFPDLRAEKFALRPRPAALLDADDDDDDAVDEPPTPMTRMAVIAAWAASIFILLVLAFVIVLARDDIMKAWPATERLFHLASSFR